MFSAQPDPQCISALLHKTPIPRWPLSVQQQPGKMEGLETGHAHPHFVLGVGQSRAAILTESTGDVREQRRGTPWSLASPRPEAGSPKHYIQAPERSDQLGSEEVSGEKTAAPLSLLQQYCNTWQYSNTVGYQNGEKVTQTFPTTKPHFPAWLFPLILHSKLPK